MSYKISREEEMKEVVKLGRGYIRFPEFLELKVSKDGSKGDCLVYPDTPEVRKNIVRAKYKYNVRDGAFSGRRFTHRFEIRNGEPVLVIQRIA